jgi:hypothetical protein
VSQLREWKKTAEERAFREITTIAPSSHPAVDQLFAPDQANGDLVSSLGLVARYDIEAVANPLRNAAKADIEAFKRLPGWPVHPVALGLTSEDRDGRRTLDFSGIANAMELWDEMAIVAAPGTGKTTTLLQLSEQMLASGHKIPVFIPLNEWSLQPEHLLASICRREAFAAFREQHLLLLAHHGRLVLLLDGWNELDQSCHRRTLSELSSLRRDYPLLGIAISTRRQALDVPISGPVVEVGSLSEQQQLEIARALRGTEGEALLDIAWRTPGVRELIAIPLYFNALISHAPAGVVPNTKEEILRLFVTEHEKSPEKSEVLRNATLGFHREFLVGLAAAATDDATTAMSESRARQTIKRTEDRLLAEGDIIGTPPQPNTILDALVDHHSLIRSAGDQGTISFQHQQFQEWFASFEVERLMRAATTVDQEAQRNLRVRVLNASAWEEQILFASERLSRADKMAQQAVASAILESLTIDPILAAEMIYRSSAVVWEEITEMVTTFAKQWHQDGVVDRAVRFMIITGRSEFAPIIWPLITNPDTQIHLSAIRAARRFRPSVLGTDVAQRIIEIPEEVRTSVIADIAMHSGIDGIALAATVGKMDSSPKVQVAIVEALLFRRADRFARQVLSVASTAVWRLLAEKGYRHELADPDLSARLKLEERELINAEGNLLRRTQLLLEFGDNEGTPEVEIAAAIESPDFPVTDQYAALAITKALERYPDKVRTAFLHRLETGMELPYRAEEVLKEVAPIDYGPLVAVILDPTTPERIARMVATVIGPSTVGILLGQFLEVCEKVYAVAGNADAATRQECHRLQALISVSRASSLTTALLEKSRTDKPWEIGVLADLLARQGSLQVGDELCRELVAAVENWSETLLSVEASTRYEFGQVARAIERVAQPELVQVLNRLFVEELARWRAARALVTAGRINVLHLYNLQYQRAFAAIGTQEVARLMETYLPDLDAGFDAACVLKSIWDRLHDMPKEIPFNAQHDFSEVGTRRTERQGGKSKARIHALAKPIFAVIERLATPTASEAEHLHALKLANVAFTMPYGDKSKLIEALLALPLPAGTKHGFLKVLVLAGEIIDADLVLDGLKGLLESAKEKPWLLHDQNRYEFEWWLELLPFSDRPGVTLEGLELLDPRFLNPWRFRGLLSALACAPGVEAEHALFELAHREERLLGNYDWVDAVINRGTASAMRRLLDLVCDGTFTGEIFGGGGWTISQKLAALALAHPGGRTELYGRYTNLNKGHGKQLVELAMAEIADADGVMVLARGYAESNRGMDGTLARAINNAVVERRPVGDWQGAYDLFGVSAAGLRKTLFGMLNEGGTAAVVGKDCLALIDQLRDEYGRPETEPRHPDIESGHPWPLV